MLMEFNAQILRGWPNGGALERSEQIGTAVTAGNFVVGATYTIVTVGTTSFTGIGATANTVGVTFVATGAGSGTGTASVVLQNGDWVQKFSDNTVQWAGATTTNSAGLVIRGNGDSYSASNSNTAVVLWSGFIAQIQNYTAGSYSPGTAVTAQNGRIKPAAPASITTSEGSNTLGDPVVGYVLDVIAGGTTTTASIVILVK